MRLSVVLRPQLRFLRAWHRVERVVPLALGRGFVRQQLGENGIARAQFQLIEELVGVDRVDVLSRIVSSAQPSACAHGASGHEQDAAGPLDVEGEELSHVIGDDALLLLLRLVLLLISLSFLHN